MKRVRKSMELVCGMLLINMCLLCYLGTLWGVSDGFPELVSAAVVCWGSLLILVMIRNACLSKDECRIVLTGYGIRVICMFMDLYGKGYVTILHSGKDSEGFYDMANRYYSGDYSGYYTKYPYVIRGFYEVFGKNRMAVQYGNVVFWVLTVLILLMLCSRFHVSRRNRLTACMLLAFLPNSIFLSSILMRESLMMFLDVWAFWHFICWMEEGRIISLTLAFLIPLPAVILHPASIGVWIAFALILSLWDKRKQRYRVSLKTGLVAFGMLTCIGIVYFMDMRSLFGGYFPEGFSLYHFTHRRYSAGNFDYLTSMDCKTWKEFWMFTAIRMFYFAFSPMITEIMSLKALAAVLGDVLPSVLVMGSIACQYRKKHCARYAFAGIVVYGVIAGIFAWGTQNAGTAMRHRGMLWGILVAVWCIGCGRKAKGEKEDEPNDIDLCQKQRHQSVGILQDLSVCERTEAKGSRPQRFNQPHI